MLPIFTLPTELTTFDIYKGYFIHTGRRWSVIGQSQNQNFTWLPNTPVVLAPTNIYRNEEREREVTTGIKTNGAARC